MIPHRRDPSVASEADKFADENYPAYTMGRAAEMLGTSPGFLRSLDEAEADRAATLRGRAPPLLSCAASGGRTGAGTGRPGHRPRRRVPHRHPRRSAPRSPPPQHRATEQRLNAPVGARETSRTEKAAGASGARAPVRALEDREQPCQCGEADHVERRRCAGRTPVLRARRRRAPVAASAGGRRRRRGRFHRHPSGDGPRADRPALNEGSRVSPRRSRVRVVTGAEEGGPRRPRHRRRPVVARPRRVGGWRAR